MEFILYLSNKIKNQAFKISTFYCEYHEILSYNQLVLMTTRVTHDFYKQLLVLLVILRNQKYGVLAIRIV